MKSAEELERQNEALRDRLSRLSEASLRINETLDLETVLQVALDSSRSMSGARYGVITLFDDARRIQEFVTSGLTEDEHRLFKDLPDGMLFFEHLGRISEPFRLRDFYDHARTLGLPEYRPPMKVSPELHFLAAPIRLGAQIVGAIYVGEKEDEFTAADEETLEIFASQVALVIANARKHEEERRARADLEALVNTAPVGVMLFDASTGEPSTINREARRIVDDLCAPGVSAEDLLDVMSFQRADGREVALDELDLADGLRSGETVRAEEMVFRAPGGQSVTVLVNATSIRSADGEVESVVVTLQDMTPIEDLQKMRAEFLAMVSHELQAPLASIRGSATTLINDEPDLDPAEMRQFFRIIDQEAGRMRGLIGELLDVARIETGTLPVDPVTEELTRLVDDARSGFRGAGWRHELQIDLASDLPLVLADRRRIVQVLGNLLSNAARHSPERSIVRISAVRDGVHVAVTVADEGEGVPVERLSDLFRKFSRLEGGETVRGVVGSGMGLAICKGIVEAHGGRIRAESDGPGTGSRFTFTIPAAREGETASAPIRGGAPVAARGGEEDRTSVLVVDDDPEALRYVRSALSKAGYAPTVTGEPEEALQMFEDVRPSVVLLDLMLPRIDGIELMRRMLEKSDVPIIFLSAYGQDEVVAKAFDAGADDYVVKPFSTTELAARIRAVLRRREPNRPDEPDEPFVLGELKIDFPKHAVSLAGRPIVLTATEYKMLFELAVNPGRVLDHDHLLKQVWGAVNSGDAGLVRTVVKRLRGKLGEDASRPNYIFTHSGVGYRMPGANDSIPSD